MKNLMTLFFLSIFISTAFAQNFDEKKASVREKYSEIEKNLEKYKKKEHQELASEGMPPVTYYNFWFNSDNKLVKANYSVGEEGYGTEKTYYFSEGKLFFVYTQEFEPDPDAEKYVQNEKQYRTYYYNELIFDCLVKEVKGSDKKYIPNKQYSGDLAKMAKKDLEEAKEMLEIAKKSK